MSNGGNAPVRRSYKSGLLGGAATALLALSALAGPAHAQQASAAVDEIVVTGSRIVNSGYTSPTPVTVVGRADLEAQAPANIGDVLTKLPAFRAGSGPQIGGVTSRGGGQYFADLRGLGANRTLVLVDGRRYVPSGLTSSVDLNQIPSLMIERAEVVTGGASAAWGSDAVAGVLNLILKKNLQGVEGEVQYGQSEIGDAEQSRVSLAGGTAFADSRGHITVGGDYDRQLGAGNQYSRDWGRQEYNTVVNTAYATNGQPNYIIAPNVRDATLFNGGVVTTAGALRNTAFGPNGQPFVFNTGTVYGSSMIGGDGYGQSRLQDAVLSSPIWRANVLGHVDYDISDSLSVFGEASYARSRLTGRSTPPRDTVVIRNDNPYLPASTLAAMNAARLTSITIGRLGDDYGFTPIQNNTATWRVAGGFKGDITDGWYGHNWKWDAYAQYGKNRYNSFIFNDRINTNFALASDPVRAPSGQIVCRSTLTNPTNGCRPLNLIGQNTVTAADVAYLSGTQEYLLYTTETVAAASLQGEPASTWAGPISIAFGAEYRNETGEATSDPISQQVQANGTIGGFLLGNPQPFDGEYHVYEYFGETVIPLAKDQAWAKSLELNAAVRRTDYSTSGPVTTWKVGVNYEPVQGLRLRTTRSRDIRAPGLSDLFSADALSGFTPVLDNRTGLSPATARHTAGNPDLLPEVADTWTAGVAWRPTQVPRLSVSVDYYSVKIQNAIASIDAAGVANNCYGGATTYCQYIHRDAAGNIVYVLQPILNLFSAETSGVDIEANYSHNLADISDSLKGTVRGKLLSTYVFHLISTDATGEHDRVGQLSTHNGNGGLPHLTVVGSIGYDIGRLTTDLQIRYIGSGKFNTDLHTGAGDINSVTNNEVPSKTYLNLSVQYDLTGLFHAKRLQAFGVITNLANTDPAIVPANGGGAANATSTNPAFYDTIGRSYRAGLRFSF